MSIGTIIREIREAQNATLEEVAFAAKTTASNLSRIELNRHGCSPKMLERLAKALGVSVADLYLRVENPESHSAKLEESAQKSVTYRNYEALNEEHQGIADDFIKMLLKRQMNCRSREPT